MPLLLQWTSHSTCQMPVHIIQQSCPAILHQMAPPLPNTKLSAMGACAHIYCLKLACMKLLPSSKQSDELGLPG